MRGRSSLELALREARRVRRNLVRQRRDLELAGACGLASVLLAGAIGDVDTLRHTVDTPHVWNKVEGVIVDVTATQFNYCKERVDVGESFVRGVLVTRVPRIYHQPVAGRGRQTLAYLSDVDWYEGQEYRRFCSAIEKLLSKKRNRVIGSLRCRRPSSHSNLSEGELKT